LWRFFGFDPEKESPPLVGVVSLALGGVTHDLPAELTSGSFQLFDSAFTEPVSPAGLEHYTFRSAGTMHARKPVDRRLDVVQVRPKDASAEALYGVVCFDPASGRPVWEVYRPKGRWKMHAGLRGLVRLVPLAPKDALGEIEHIALRYDEDPAAPAVPIEARAEGTMYWIADQVVMPVSLEWKVAGQAPLGSSPAGSTSARTNAPPPPLTGGHEFAPDRGVLSPYLRQLDRVTGAPPWPRLGRVLGSTAASIRFNQVQGVYFKVGYPMPLAARTYFTPTIGIATSGFEPTGELALQQKFRPWSWGVRGYSELQDANWMEKPNGFASSITAIVSGYDDGNYYLARGAMLWGAVRDRPVSARFGVFAERHFNTPKTAHWSLFTPKEPPDSTVVLVADEGFFCGVRGQLEIQRGVDPQRGVLVGRAQGQAAVGDYDFVSVGLTGDAVGPLFWRLAGALRAGLVVAGGEVPTQGLSYLGGAKTVRGYPPNAAVGESAFTLNAEIGNDLPLLRVILFSDLGWANEVGALFDGEALVATGVGLSTFDGTMRLDFAKGLTRNGQFRVQFSTSGLF
jgi:hypothetical protein